MAILLSIDATRLKASSRHSRSHRACDDMQECETRGHSQLARDQRRADAMLAKLVRIHRRQVAQGSPASNWDPITVWSSMLRDCCKRDQPED